jgi:hypothetical protein
MSIDSNQVKKRINPRSLWCALLNLASGALLLINPLFASPANLNHIQSGSRTITWFAIPLGFIVSIAALVQIIIALVKRRTPAPKTGLNQSAYVAIALATCYLPLIFIKHPAIQVLNNAVVWIVIGILLVIFARKSKVQNLVPILISAILLLVAISLALTIAEII